MIARVAAVLALAWLLGFAAWSVSLPGPADGRATDGIVVPTGAAGRIKRGIALLQAGHARRVLISGVAPGTGAAAIAAENDLPAAPFACCVDLGTEASDTRSNGAETARWLRGHGFRSVRLVTTDWHMPRARFELARAAPGVLIVEDGVRSEPGLTTLLREYNKWLLARAAAPLGL